MISKTHIKKLSAIGLLLLMSALSVIYSTRVDSQENDRGLEAHVGPTPTFSPTPLPSVAFPQHSLFFQDESASAFVYVSRQNGHYIGPLDFRVTTINGTATGGATCSPGVDYVALNAVPFVLNFGQNSMTIEVPLCSDGILEPNETVGLSISGNVSAPTSANLIISDLPLRYTISGRVLTADGRGIRNAEVVLPSNVGPHRYTRTGAFGWYSFDGLAPGRSYSINVSTKQFTFQIPFNRVDFLSGDVSDLNFVAEPLP